MLSDVLKEFIKITGEPVGEDTMWHFNKAGIDKLAQFITEQLEKLAKEIIGKEELSVLSNGYNQHRQEGIDIAKRWGLNIK